MFDMDLPDNLFQSNIYTVSSVRPKLSVDPNTYDSQKDAIVESIQNERAQNCQYSSDTAEITSCDSLGTTNFLIMYHAAKIESSITEMIDTDSRTLYCNEENSSCQNVFDVNEKVLLIFILMIDITLFIDSIQS